MYTYLRSLFSRSSERNLGIQLNQSGSGPVVVLGPDQRQIFTTESSALALTAYWSSIRVISETIASLPRSVYGVDLNGTEKEDRGHWLYQLLNDPSDHCSAADFWQALLAQANHYGNGYAFCENSGPATRLTLLPHGQCSVYPFAVDGQLYYSIHGKKYTPDRVLHLKGLTLDGICGISPLQQHARTLGIASSLNQHVETLFVNGCQSQLVIYTPPTSPEKTKEITDQIKQAYTGSLNAGKPLIFSQGFKVENLTFSPENSQLLESRKYSAIEIARIFRVPPHKLAELDRATFSNIEHQSIEFVQDCLVPWLTKLEEEISRKLLPFNEQGKIFPHFEVEGLLRGDLSSRYNAYKSALGAWLTPNEIRAKEGLSPLAGGDTLHQPLNVTPIGSPAPEQETPAPDNKPELPPASIVKESIDPKRAIWPCVEDAIRSLATKEIKAFQRMQGDAAVQDEFIAQHSDLVRSKLAPAIEGLAALDGSIDREALLNRLGNEYVKQIFARRKEGLSGSIDEYIEQAVKSFKGVWDADSQ